MTRSLPQPISFQISRFTRKPEKDFYYKSRLRTSEKKKCLTTYQNRSILVLAQSLKETIITGILFNKITIRPIQARL